MSSTAPGWYDDGHGARRWWDGRQWTEQVHAESDAVAPDPAATAPTASAPVGDGASVVQPLADGPGSEPPKTSKLWIVWVVVAGVVALLIVLAVILISVISGFAESVSRAAGADSPDEAAAVAVVESYDEAWAEGDCAELEASTTEEFRTLVDIADCAAFEEQAAYLDETTDDYDLAITSVQPQPDGTIEVSTTETYTSTVDENGDTLAEPMPAEDHYRYVVVEVDGAWVIDDATFE